MHTGDLLARNVPHDQIGLVRRKVAALTGLRGRHRISRQIEYIMVLGARIRVQIVSNVLLAWVLLLLPIFERRGEDR